MKRPFSFQLKLFLAFALSMLIATALLTVFTRDALYRDRVALATDQAVAQARLIRSLAEQGRDEAWLDAIFTAVKGSGTRLTLIDASGRVLRDTHIPADQLPGLDNHSDRPEIEQARTDGTGLALRRSTSLDRDEVYAAVRLHDGGSVRVAVPLAEIRRQPGGRAWPVAAAAALAALACLAFSFFITRRARRRMAVMSDVVRSISLDRPSRRLHEAPGSEYQPLAHAVNSMADSLEKSMSVIRDQRNQLETILESMNEGVLVLDANGHIRLWNRALERFFPQIVHASGKQVIEGIPVPLLQSRVAALLDGGVAERAQFQFPAGRFFFSHLTRPVEPSDSLGAVIVFYDATEILRLERVRKDFVSNVSHELRTPLTALAGYAELLLDCPGLDDDYRGFVEAIGRHTAALKKVISDLFDLARLENSQEEIVTEDLNPARAFDQALELCRGQAEKKDLRIIVDLPDARVQANDRLIAQVFRNLLENACRYAPPGSEIRVCGEAREHDVLFIVADQGPGIRKEDLERIFERFYQVKKERNSGTAGVGLAVCKHIIERHNGKIWAESPYGGAGTAMLFTLPAAAEKELESRHDA